MILHSAGPLTTVQDAGRPGARAVGVPAGGAMDGFALAVANVLVGNPPGAAAIEATLVGPVVTFDADAILAVCGAEPAHLEGWRAHRIGAGQRLDLRHFRSGCRAVLAVAGGIDVPEVLGSRATYLAGGGIGFGGHMGRRLIDGDRLPVGPTPLARAVDPGGRVAPSVLPPYPAGNSAPTDLRILPGEQAQLLPVRLFGQVFTVSPDSSRMGIRLREPCVVPDDPAMRTLGGLPSRVTVAGAIQLPPDGRAIVLGADAQTIGGYAVIGYVIAADLPILAQLRPGDTVRFGEVSMESARAALDAQRRAIAVLRARVQHA